MNSRGAYGETSAAVSREPKSLLGTWVVGGLLVGGAVLWARHQSSQLEKLYASGGLPYQTFGASLRAQTRELSSTALEKIQELTRRLDTRERRKGVLEIAKKKEIGHG